MLRLGLPDDWPYQRNEAHQEDQADEHHGRRPGQGIPIAAFEVDDIAEEFKLLKGRGVVFTQPPARSGPVTVAICSDTCGNLIQLYQPGTPRPPG
jgi:hypothetical protein